MQPKYFGARRLIMGFLPKISDNKRGPIINISLIGVLSNAPRFSAHVASKSALDSFAACAASEFVDKKISTTCRLLAQRIALRDNAQDSVGASGARKRVSEAMG